MEMQIFKDIKAKIGKLNCMNQDLSVSTDIYNYSTAIEPQNLHTRANSDTTGELYLSQTQRLPKISIISEQPEYEENSRQEINIIIKTNNTLLCRKYLNLKANFLYVNNKKRTYLHKAAKLGSLEICQLLLAYTSINVNSKDVDLRSPIHIAALHNHTVIVQYLHRCGGYLHIKDKFSNTVLDYAIENKNTELINFVFEKSPSLTKSLGFNMQQLLQSQGIPIEINRTKIGDDKSKAKKIEAPNDSIGYHDFIPLELLGKGSFGMVYLVRLKNTNQLFAMKILNKEKIFEEKLEVYLKTEKNVMAYVKSPFITQLFYSFQTPQFFCLVMDFCPGGTLANVISKQRVMPENKARLYLCEILLGIEDLHKKNIIYRDLKPENILLDELGHIKLSDFGLSKEGANNEFSGASFCGTIGYLAPEILEKVGHGKCVD